MEVFMAQHMMMKKAIVQEILTKIDVHPLVKDSWDSKIMRSLPSNGVYLFSEYGTFSCYCNMHYPDQSSKVKWRWLQNRISHLGNPATPANLVGLSASFDCASFTTIRLGWPSPFCRKKAIA